MLIGSLMSQHWWLFGFSVRRFRSGSRTPGLQSVCFAGPNCHTKKRFLWFSQIFRNPGLFLKKNVFDWFCRGFKTFPGLSRTRTVSIISELKSQFIVYHFVVSVWDSEGSLRSPSLWMRQTCSAVYWQKQQLQTEKFISGWSKKNTQTT